MFYIVDTSCTGCVMGFRLNKSVLHQVLLFLGNVDAEKKPANTTYNKTM